MTRALAFLAMTLVATAAWAAGRAAVEVEPINPKADHVERWNWFARAVYALHTRQIAGRELRTVERTGGYARRPGFYREASFFDRESGKLISRVQRETANPQRLHSIEVYVHDASGRVARDYGAWFLPHSRTAPQATVINLHAYNGELKAMRQFNATDERIYEVCEGRYRGKPVAIELWELDILRLEGEPDTVMTTPEYAACFRGLPVGSAGKYLTPQ